MKEVIYCLIGWRFRQSVLVFVGGGEGVDDARFGPKHVTPECAELCVEVWLVHSSDFYVKAVSILFVESFPTHFPGSSTNRNHSVLLLKSTHLVIVGKQTSQYIMGLVDVCTVVDLQQTCNNLIHPRYERMQKLAYRQIHSKIRHAFCSTNDIVICLRKLWVFVLSEFTRNT